MFASAPLTTHVNRPERKGLRRGSITGHTDNMSMQSSMTLNLSTVCMSSVAERFRKSFIYKFMAFSTLVVRGQLWIALGEQERASHRISEKKIEVGGHVPIRLTNGCLLPRHRADPFLPPWAAPSSLPAATTLTTPPTLSIPLPRRLSRPHDVRP